MLSHFAATLCMACDPNYKSNFGLNIINSSLKMSMSSNTCNKFMDACFPYLNDSY